MADIVERLRAWKETGAPARDCREAATEIESLRAKLREAEEKRERIWCLACGTVTRSDQCDCSRGDVCEPNFVNYADQLQKDVREACEENTQLRVPVEGLKSGDTIPVPKAALDWLFGAGPDEKGWLFGDCRVAQLAMNTKNPRRYWWRAKFRKMIPALALPSTERT